MDEVCAAAAQEDPFIYWAGLDQGSFGEINAAFKEQYPDNDATYLQISSGDLIERIIVESTAGRQPEVDLARGGLSAMHSLVGRDLIDTEIDWEALGVSSELVASGMVRNYRTVGGIAFNTDLVSADDLPETWEELREPEWAGERAIFDLDAWNYRSLALAWGVDETVEWLEATLDNMDPVLVSGLTPALQTVASGEVPWTTYGRDAEVRELQADGAPLEIKYLDFVPTNDAYNAILKNAPHRNGAMCYLAWLATPAGAEVFAEVDLKFNDSVPPSAPEGAEVLVALSPEEIALEQEATGRLVEVLASH